MANIRLIKGRIRSAKSIAQITKAMELVAASKMRKAQIQALAGKLYAGKIYDMVQRLSRSSSSLLHPLFKIVDKPKGMRLVIVLSTNKGLCGGLNTNLFRFLLRSYENVTTHRYVTIGSKGAGALSQLGATVIADFSVSTTGSVVPALTELITSQFLSGEIDGVDILYNEFVSALKQIPQKKSLLPLVLPHVKSGEDQKLDFLIEPSKEEVFNTLLPHYIENQIRDTILQANASEHSARMVAMRNATDNALSFMEELTLLYNKARQEKITYEISDMVTARLAVE